MPSEETIEDLALALQQVQSFTLCGDAVFDGMEFPEDRIASALARDGEACVIAYLAELAARAARGASAISGQDPQELIRHFVTLIDLNDQPPGTGLAWKRGCDAVLHLLGAPRRIAGVGPVEAADVAVALMCLRALARIEAVAWKQNPDRMRKNLAARQAPAPGHP